MATIKSVNISLDDVNSIINVEKSPIDVANNIKSYATSEGNTLDKMQMMVSALGTLETFASAISKYETSIPGTTLSSASLLLNITKAYNEMKPPEEGGYGNVTNGTLNSIMADLSSLTANAGLALKIPYIVGLGLTASTAFSVAAFMSDEGDTWMADKVVDFAHTLSENFNAIQDSLNTYAVENNTNVDSIIGECLKTQNVVQTQYNESINYNSSLAEWLKQNDTTIKLDTLNQGVVKNLEDMGVKQVLIENETYTIQNGDNLSQIAQDNNTTVDKLIENNSWLTEENRISSDRSYVLIKAGEKLNLTVDNKTTGYGIDDTNTLTPEYQIDLTTQDIISLKEGQTVSDIAKLTNKSSIDLLEYNNMTMEEARSLPVGEPIRIYEGEPTVITGEYGNIKLFENPDGSTTAILPNQDNVTYSSENDLLIYGDYTNPNKISFTNTSTGDFEVWEKDASGSMYQSQVSTEDFSINYTPSDDSKSKVVSNIEILSDNASFEDIAPHTDFSADDLREFNDYPEGTAITRDSIDIPKSKELLDGGNGFIVHLSGFNGNEMFIVPNQDGTSTKYTTFIDGNNNQALYETNSNGSTTVTLSNTDGSTRTIISNSDGYSFDSYGVSDVADISYTELPNGDLQVSGFVPKQDMTFVSVSNNIFARAA